MGQSFVWDDFVWYERGDLYGAIICMGHLYGKSFVWNERGDLYEMSFVWYERGDLYEIMGLYKSETWLLLTFVVHW